MFHFPVQDDSLRMRPEARRRKREEGVSSVAKRRFLELAIEVGIGVAVVTVVIAYALYVPKGTMPEWLSLNVLASGAMMLGGLLHRYRRYRSRNAGNFWEVFRRL